MNFQKIADALAHIADTGSTIEKSYLLKKYGSEIEGFKDVLQFIFDPYFSTCIGKRKLDRVGSACMEVTVEEVMQHLRENCTGNDYDATLANDFIWAEEDTNWQWAATGLVTKDLQIGASVTTLNDVFGAGFIPIIGIMRGKHCPDNAKGIYIATEKIDGNRRLIFTIESGIEIYTRSGRRDIGLVEIEEQAKALPKGYVFDSECVACGDYADSIELRQASASILNSRSKNRTGVKALCFDMLPIEEYNQGRSKHAAFARKARLAGTFDDMSALMVMQRWFMENTDESKLHIGNSINAQFCCHGRLQLPNITCLPILGIVTNKKEAIELAKPIWETGGEGIMLVEHRSAYEVNPNPRSTLLKIKATKEYALQCIGVFEGKNRLEGTLGGIYVEYRASNGKTYTVACGSGFPDYLRYMYWDHPALITGKKVEIESFGESRNAAGDYSLNCPIFKRIKGAKE